MLSPKLLPRLAAALALFAFSHAAPAMAQTPRPIAIGQPFIAAGLDPVKANNGWALTSHGIAQNLFIVTKEGVVTPWLAESVDRVDDRVWIVKLKPGVKFADGAPLTAADVGAALSRSNELSGPARASTGRIATLALDPLTLRIDTERLVPNMASVLADWPQVIYKAVARAGGDDFVFTGPFMVTGMVAGDEFRLAPNPHYPNAAKRPALRIKYFGDPQAMALALQSGDLDMAFGVPAEALARIAQQPGLHARTMVEGYMYLLLTNQSRAPLDDPKLREAVDLALDRDTLVKAGKGGRAAEAIFSAAFPYALKHKPPFDPARAASLLDEAGWKQAKDGIRAKDGKRLQITVVCASIWPDLLVYAPVMKAGFQKIGIDLQVRMIETFLPVANAGDFDLLFRMTHTGRAGDPTLFLNDSLKSTAVRNWGKYRGQELDQVLATLESELDPARRGDLIRDAQRIVARDRALIPVSEAPFHVGLSARLKDYPLWGADYYIVRDDLVIQLQ